VPDANTIWTFREALTRVQIEGKPAIDVLFARFDAALRQAGFLAMGGQIVDASIVACPKQIPWAGGWRSAQWQSGVVHPPLWRRPCLIELTLSKSGPPSAPILEQFSCRWN
jgi:hypothetical protein